MNNLEDNVAKSERRDMFSSTRQSLSILALNTVRNLGRLCRLFTENNYKFGPSYKQTETELQKHKSNFYKENIVCRVRSGRQLTGTYSELNSATNFIEQSNSPFYLRIANITTNEGWCYQNKSEPLTATAEELIQNPNLDFDQTTLHRYFETFRPKSLSESLFIDDSTELDSISPYLYFRPWIHSKPTIPTGGLFGPKDNSAVQHRVYRTLNLIELLSEYSYVPTANDIVMGFVLKHADDFRFVLTVGHHRVAVISAFVRQGITSDDRLLVKIDNRDSQIGTDQIGIFDRLNSKQWPGVASGFISEEGALKLFDSFFCDRKFSIDDSQF